MEMEEKPNQVKIKFNWKNIFTAFLFVLLVVGGFVFWSINYEEKVEISEGENIVEGGAEEVNDLKKEDLEVGEGVEVKKGDTVSVHYTGTLTNGTKFDSSLDRNQPFEFTVGDSQVIAGWEVGLVGMKVGGKRKLTIPPALGYGDRGAGASIPPNSTLIFEIELLEIK